MAAAAEATTRVVDVDFQAAPLEGATAALATDDPGSAPRPSRRIVFTDDGKLFEGHLTVQSRNLKSIIQLLVDQHAEQTVILQDLQDQVSGLRTKLTRASRTGASLVRSGAGGPGAGPMELDEINKRVKRLESFVTLWGVRAEDVDALVQSYGDPVITPEQYTSYLLDLPCFRLTRREARALAASAAANSVVVGPVGRSGSIIGAPTAQDTAARRGQAQGRAGGEQRPAASPAAVPPGGVGGASDDARRALEGVAEAMRRIADLEKHQPRSQSERGDGGAGGGAVDAQARQDIDELGEFVARRLQELESRVLLGGGGGGGAVREPMRPTTERPPRRPSLSSSGGDQRGHAAPSEAGARDRQPRPQPPPPAQAGAGVVDPVARQDAADSLDMIEALEATMERRFRDLAAQIANAAQRRPAASPTAAPPPTAPPAPAGGGDAAGEPTGRAAGKGPGGRRGAPEARGAGPAAAAAPPALSPPVTPTHGGGAALDAASRDEVVALSDRLADMEEEVGKRWQSIEERLRIIGRASMGRAGGPGAGGAGGGASVDRKAREDASLSLMRVQQLERELAALRRQLTAAAAPGGWGSSSAMAESASAGPEGPLRAGAAALSNALAVPPENLRDTYTSTINDLEKEVEQRLLEVNRAIALLKQGESTAGGVFASGQGVPSSLESALMRAAAAAPSSSASPPVVPLSSALVSGEGLAPSPAPEVEAAAAAAVASRIVLRSHEGDGENPSTPPPTVNRREDMGDAKSREPRGYASVPWSARPLSPVLQLSSNPLSGGGSNPLAPPPRRLTVSRLRAPNEPLLGSHLVVRDTVTGEELESLLAMVGSPAAAARAGASPRAGAATEVAAASTSPVSPAAAAAAGGGLAPSAEAPAERPTLVHPLAQELAKGRGVAAAAASLQSKRTGSNPHAAHEVTTSALGHTTPCVIVNCAWCKAERSGAGPRPYRAEVA